MATTADSVSVGTATATLYTDNGLDADKIAIKNSKDSTVSVLVHVAGLHATNEFATLEPGDFVAFPKNQSGGPISSVTAKTASGTATVNWTILQK